MIDKFLVHLYKNLSNEQLAKIIKRQNPSSHMAFHLLYQNLASELFNYLFYILTKKEIAEELTNESFFLFFQSIDRYDPNKRVKPWLWRIARNQAFNYLKKHKETLLNDYNTAESSSDPIQELKDTQSDDQLEKLIKNETQQFITQHILKLKTSQREALELWIEDYTFEQISTIINKSPQAVKNLIFRAKQKLIHEIQQSKKGDI